MGSSVLFRLVWAVSGRQCGWNMSRLVKVFFQVVFVFVFGVENGSCCFLLLQIILPLFCIGLGPSFLKKRFSNVLLKVTFSVESWLLVFASECLMFESVEVCLEES